MTMSEVIERVRRYWLAQGLTVNTVDPKSIALELHGEMPAAYAELLRTVGVPNDEDVHGFRFWHPHEFRSARQVLTGADCPSDVPETWVIIADYLQESWWYAMDFAGADKGRVFLVLGSAADPTAPIGDVSRFLQAYLDDDEILYPPER